MRRRRDTEEGTYFWSHLVREVFEGGEGRGAHAGLSWGAGRRPRLAHVGGAPPGGPRGPLKRSSTDTSVGGRRQGAPVSPSSLKTININVQQQQPPTPLSIRTLTWPNCQPPPPSTHSPTHIYNI